MGDELDLVPADVSDAFRQALTFREVEEGPDIMTTRELAEVLGLKMSATRERIVRAIKAGRMERVNTRRDGKVIPGYRVVGNGREP